MEQPRTERQDRMTARLVGADRFDGLPVLNTEGGEVGRIRTLIIDKRSGRVAYAVVTFGGFLGVAEQHHPVPWTRFTYDAESDGFVTRLTREDLEKAPTCDPEGDDPWQDDMWTRRIDNHFGVMTLI